MIILNLKSSSVCLSHELPYKSLHALALSLPLTTFFSPTYSSTIPTSRLALQRSYLTLLIMKAYITNFKNDRRFISRLITTAWLLLYTRFINTWKNDTSSHLWKNMMTFKYIDQRDDFHSDESFLKADCLHLYAMGSARQGRTVYRLQNRISWLRGQEERRKSSGET